MTPPALSDWTDRRGQILAALEEASHQSLHATDALPDTLIAHAQALGMHPHELRSWIHDSSARPDWRIESLQAFARRYGFARTPEPAEVNG